MQGCAAVLLRWELQDKGVDSPTLKVIAAGIQVDL
jgi:hypothetical protein